MDDLTNLIKIYMQFGLEANVAIDKAREDITRREDNAREDITRREDNARTLSYCFKTFI